MEVRAAEVLEPVLDHAREFLNSLESGSVVAERDYSEILSSLPSELAAKGSSPQQVVRALITHAEGGITRNAGGRFFGWVMGGTLPSSLAADWLCSTWDQNAATAIAAPAACAIETAAGDLLIDLLGLPSEASFAFTTGCQMAHATCLAAARNAVLAELDWDVEKHGLVGAPPFPIIVGSNRHGSVDRALRLLGLGSATAMVVEETRDGTIDNDVLLHELAAQPGPGILILSAGDLNIGAFDDFAHLIPAAKRAGYWVHIDGAFGLWLRASERFGHLTDGIELADSWATDSHKWLNVPYDSGFAVVADASAHLAAMGMTASYVEMSDTARDPINYTPEWSRRARGVPVYAALQELGREGLANLLERCCHIAGELVTRIGSLDGAELLHPPISNQGLVRFLDPKPTATDGDHDLRTAHVVQRMRDSGTAYFTDTVWRGRRAMRVSVVNWTTTAQDVDLIVGKFAELLKQER